MIQKLMWRHGQPCGRIPSLESWPQLSSAGQLKIFKKSRFFRKIKLSSSVLQHIIMGICYVFLDIMAKEVGKK